MFSAVGKGMAERMRGNQGSMGDAALGSASPPAYGRARAELQSTGRPTYISLHQLVTTFGRLTYLLSYHHSLIA